MDTVVIKVRSMRVHFPAYNLAFVEHLLTKWKGMLFVHVRVIGDGIIVRSSGGLCMGCHASWVCTLKDRVHTTGVASLETSSVARSRAARCRIAA